MSPLQHRSPEGKTDPETPREDRALPAGCSLQPRSAAGQSSWICTRDTVPPLSPCAGVAPVTILSSQWEIRSGLVRQRGPGNAHPHRGLPLPCSAQAGSVSPAPGKGPAAFHVLNCQDSRWGAFLLTPERFPIPKTAPSILQNSKDLNPGVFPLRLPPQILQNHQGQGRCFGSLSPSALETGQERWGMFSLEKALGRT